MNKPGVGAPIAPTEPLLLTIPQAAKLLQVSSSKAYLMAQRGELPSIRIGRSIRVEPNALLQWIREQRQGA